MRRAGEVLLQPLQLPCGVMPQNRIVNWAERFL